MSIHEINWTPWQTAICMNVALAKLNAFAEEAYRAADDVRRGVVTKADAADGLHEAAIYNQLYFEYGTERIQQIMADAFLIEVAA